MLPEKGSTQSNAPPAKFGSGGCCTPPCPSLRRMLSKRRERALPVRSAPCSALIPLAPCGMLPLARSQPTRLVRFRPIAPLGPPPPAAGVAPRAPARTACAATTTWLETNTAGTGEACPAAYPAPASPPSRDRICLRPPQALLLLRLPARSARRPRQAQQHATVHPAAAGRQPRPRPLQARPDAAICPAGALAIGTVIRAAAQPRRLCRLYNPAARPVSAPA